MKQIALSVLIVIALSLIGSTKSGYHEDEMYTFGLSNHQYEDSIGPDIQDGESYTGQQLWQEYMTVSEENTFDYGNVFVNQEHDVHPPLYYILVHTVCSFFPSVYGVWMGLAINIGLALIVFWQMVWLFRYFTDRQTLAIIFSLCFLFTMGFVNSVAFFRMYVLLTVWTNALAILFCKYRADDKRKSYYILLILILAGGTMTQYYFLIFAFFACLAYGVFLIRERNWSKLAFSVLSAGTSFGVSTLIFPAMWEQIFSGSRGTEAFDNLTAKSLWNSLWTYLELINQQVFGNLFMYLLFAAVILFVISSERFAGTDVKKCEMEKTVIPGEILGENTGEKAASYLQLLIPTVGYVILVAKIAPFDTDRYIMNVMGMLYLLMFVALIELAGVFSGKAVAGVLLSAFLVLFCSYRDGTPHLMTSENNNVETVENLGSDVPCLYVHGANWKILPNYLEMADLQQIVFLKKGKLDELGQADYQNYDKLLLYIINTVDAGSVIQQLLNQNSGLDSYTALFTSGYATAYYLE